MDKAILGVLLMFTLCLTPAAALELDLETTLQLAVKHNRDLQLAQLEVQSVGAEKSAAYSRAFPKVSLDAGYQRQFLEQESLIPSYKNQFQVGGTVNQILFNLGVFYAIQAARYLNRFSTHQFEDARQIVITRIKKAFYRVLLLKEVYAVARDSEASARDNYENIKDRFESGVASEYDLLQAEVNWQNSIPQRIKARRDYELSLNNLKTLAGIPLEEELLLKGSLESYPGMPETATFQQAVGRRSDVKALEWQKRLQEINTRAQQAAYFPTLLASLSYSATAASDAFKWENDSDSLIFGLLLSIPVFTGGNTSAQVRKARTEMEKVKTRLAQLRESIQVELSNISLRLREAGQRIEATRRSVVTARRAYEIAESRVENQLATQVELKEIRLALSQAQLNYYSAINDYLAAYFDWEAAIGMVDITGL